jgi:valyl-tRNA synthetase
VYLHGLVRVDHGRKMSKTLGNVIDPLEVMDEFGTDALRFTLLTGSTPGADMSLSLQRVAANRNFANKLWNAGRLVLMGLEKAPASPTGSVEPTLADRWIETRLNELLSDVDRLFARHQYAEAGRQVYEYFWGEFADWYLEIAKIQIAEGDDRAWLTAKIMVFVLDSCLRMLHPFMPFVTEELWGRLKTACEHHPAGFSPASGWEEALIIAHWPEGSAKIGDEEQVIDHFSQIMDLVRAIRNIRAEKGVESTRRIPAIINGGNLTDLIDSQRQVVATLAHLDMDKLQIHDSLESPPPDSVPLVVGSIEAYLPLKGMFDLEVERLRLSKELDMARTQITRLEKLLVSSFSERAPVDVVEKERVKLSLQHETAKKLKSQLDALG